MKEGTIFPTKELASVVREAWLQSGKTQVEAAKDFGVTQPAFAQAVNEPKRALDKLRTSIIERYTEFTIEGPSYQIVKKGQQ